MAVSAARLEELRKDFESVKKKIDDVDRKYSLDYSAPILDMPERLDLPRLEYKAKSEGELKRLADEQTYAGYLVSLNRLDGGRAADMLKLDMKLLTLEEKCRVKIAELLNKLNNEIEDVDVKLTNAGMLFSTVAERVKIKLRRDYESKVEQNNASADNERNAVEAERERITASYNESLAALQAQRQAQTAAAYNKLVQSEQKEKTRVEKYNNSLDEKETKYLMSRAKALEAARQAEYDRAYKARKLAQQMGAVGYEQAILWEKYNLLTSYFSDFGKREEALILIQGDSYVQGHLKQYYSSLIDWVNRNVPA